MLIVPGFAASWKDAKEGGVLPLQMGPEQRNEGKER